MVWVPLILENEFNHKNDLIVKNRRRVVSLLTVLSAASLQSNQHGVLKQK